MNLLQQPFFQVALPIIVTFAIATWYQSRRIDDLRDVLGKRLDDLRDSVNRRIDEVSRRIDGLDRRLDRMDGTLTRIEGLLGNHTERIAKLEERTGPLRVR